MKKRTDSQGRIWEYNDCEGTYRLGEYLIGCGVKNGRKWCFWEGKDELNPVEFRTLREAMESAHTPTEETAEETAEETKAKKGRGTFFAHAICDTENIRYDNISIENARTAVYEWSKFKSVRWCRIGHMSDINRPYNAADIIVDAAKP